MPLVLSNGCKSRVSPNSGSYMANGETSGLGIGELGIRSNVVVPGFMETAMSATLTEEQKNRIYKHASLKTATSVCSVAETVAFLLPDGACSITGIFQKQGVKYN